MAGRLNRRLALAALVLAVLVGHGWVAERLAETMNRLATVQPKPMRLQAVFVRDMALAPAVVAAPAAPPAFTPAAPAAAAPAAPGQAASAPDAAASKPRPDRTRALAQRRASAALLAARATADPASQPGARSVPLPDSLQEPAPVPVPAPEPFAVALPGPAAEPLPAPRAEPAPTRAPIAGTAVAEPQRVLIPPTTVDPVTAAAASLAASAAGDPSAPPFDWPVSTRVSYRLTGNVRGEVNGDAQVEWLRVDNRYQVHLDVTVGLSFAPLMTRSMSSDGDITPQGLSPRRYDQDTKIGFGARQKVVVLFEPAAVVLSNGQRRERLAGMQDTASQFIQLTYLFSTRPELLRPGGALEVPLALPRNTSRWVYDVLGEETVYTPIGHIQAVHLKPRRVAEKGSDLSAEIWFAPELRYLPVRIRIQQDAETFIDLVMARTPQLAAQ